MDFSELTDDQLWDEVLKPRLSAKHDWSEILASPEIERIAVILLRITHDMHGQFAVRKTKVSGFDPSEERKRAIHFKMMLDRRLSQVKEEAKKAKARRHEEHQNVIVAANHGVIRRLAQAVDMHRRSALEEGAEPHPRDVALWRFVDEIEVRRDGKTTKVSELLKIWPTPDKPNGMDAADQAPGD